MAVVMPPSSVKLVQPYRRGMSHSRDFEKRRDNTQGMALTSAVPSVITCALAWVSDNPEYRRSSGLKPNRNGVIFAVSQ